jgi:hypothetical protein
MGKFGLSTRVRGPVRRREDQIIIERKSNVGRIYALDSGANGV